VQVHRLYIKEVDKMTKTECKKILPYKTITACEKAYKKLTQNIFDFELIFCMPYFFINEKRQ
jgi:hypothetical protein